MVLGLKQVAFVVAAVLFFVGAAIARPQGSEFWKLVAFGVIALAFAFS